MNSLDSFVQRKKDTIFYKNLTIRN